jgi:hypothetical protein
LNYTSLEHRPVRTAQASARLSLKNA